MFCATVRLDILECLLSVLSSRHSACVRLGLICIMTAGSCELRSWGFLDFSIGPACPLCQMLVMGCYHVISDKAKCQPASAHSRHPSCHKTLGRGHVSQTGLCVTSIVTRQSPDQNLRHCVMITYGLGSLVLIDNL